MNFLKTHFQNYQKLSPFRFCLLITIESVLLSFIVGSIIELIWGIPIRSFVNLPIKRLFILLVISAPLIETLIFQTIPISIIKWFKISFSIQIFISFLLFAVAHFFVGWQVGISAGIIAGFYLAFTYAHWINKSHLTAFWTTALSHSIRNFIAFIFIIIFLSQFEDERIQYDFFANPNFGSIYHFHNSNEQFVFSIIDENIKERHQLSVKDRKYFMGSFFLVYENKRTQFSYNSNDTTLSINNIPYSLTKFNVFYLMRSDTGFVVEPSIVKFSLSDNQQDMSFIRNKLEAELKKRYGIRP